LAEQFKIGCGLKAFLVELLELGIDGGPASLDRRPEDGQLLWTL
jgi:hypothetical protein